MVQMDFLAAYHVRIVGLCSRNKAHRAIIFAISQLSCFITVMMIIAKGFCTVLTVLHYSIVISLIFALVLLFLDLLLLLHVRLICANK